MLSLERFSNISSIFHICICLREVSNSFEVTHLYVMGFPFTLALVQPKNSKKPKHADPHPKKPPEGAPKGVYQDASRMQKKRLAGNAPRTLLS